MAVSNSFETLRDNVSDGVFTDGTRSSAIVSPIALVFPDEIEDSALDKFKDKVEIISDANHFFELDDVLVVQFPKVLDLAQRHTLVPRCKLLLHLLDRDHFMSLLIYCFDHGSISTIANVLYNLEFVHDR